MSTPYKRLDTRTALGGRRRALFSQMRRPQLENSIGELGEKFTVLLSVQTQRMSVLIMPYLRRGNAKGSQRRKHRKGEAEKLKQVPPSGLDLRWRQ